MLQEAAAGGHAAAGATTTPRKRQRIPIASTDDYDEIRRLGAGGFGVVTKARHRATGEAVAIKRLRSRDGRNGELLREAHFLDACCKAGQPFLVGYRGLARDRATGDLCLVMEYVGPSLQDYLRERRRRRSPPLPEATVRAAMWQLLTAAQSMHDRRVVHRDIKPANILVGDGRRTVKICDLGLAVSMAEPPPYSQAGTLPYMAPEVLRGETDYDDLVDAWSLGCVMAELIAGRPLFEGHDDEVLQLWAIFDMLDVPPDGTTSSGFAATPLAAEMLATLHAQRRNRLRELFPEKTLSKEGFEVLSGLLEYNTDKRLRAADALSLPWFSKVDALALPGDEEVAIAPLPLCKKKRVRLIAPPLPKRLKIC
ncbi:hypothetical protein ACP70R_033074 [Stipagrostis hirtigluma subsp. patula]